MKNCLPILFLFTVLCSLPSVAEAQDTWLLCTTIDGQQTQVSIPKEPLRVRSESGEWRIPLGALRELKMIQREGATEVRLIYPNGFVAGGKILNREIDMRTPEGSRINLNVRVIQSIANPILGGITLDGELLTRDIVGTLTDNAGQAEQRGIAFSQHRFKGEDHTLDVAIPQMRSLQQVKSGRYVLETIYGDRVTGKLDPAKLYTAGVDGRIEFISAREVSQLNIQGRNLEVGGGYLWWVLKNGDRFCGRPVQEGGIALRTEDGAQIRLAGIRSLQAVGKDTWEVSHATGVSVGRPLGKRIVINSMIDSALRELAWKDIDYVVLPDQDIAAPLAPSIVKTQTPEALPETFTPVSPTSSDPFDTPINGMATTVASAGVGAAMTDFPNPADAGFPTDDPGSFSGDAPLPAGPKAITPPPGVPPDEWLNSTLELEFREALLPGGSFKLGDSKNRGLEDEQPAIAVDVRSFFMDVTEVSVAAFRTFTAENKRFKTQAERNKNLSNWRKPGFTQRDDEPVVWISWVDAVEYCNWRSKKMGLESCYASKGGTIRCDRTKNGYRLPTEAEWEFAVRDGGQDRVYPFATAGDDLSIADAVNLANFRQKPGALFDGYRFTSPSGSYAANRFGIFDLSGNVWEWCEDYYHREAYYYVLSREKNDPCVEIGDAARLADKCMRGGSWENESLDFLRTSSRGKGPMSGSKASVGFRCVRTAP